MTSVPGLRERKKQQTRETIRRQALRLFRDHGFDATTVEQIAAAADVSHMTFYRHFPTKEAVVFVDVAEIDLDALPGTSSVRSDDGAPLVDRVQALIRGSLAAVYAADRATLLERNRLVLATPALSARVWEDHVETRDALIAALGLPDDPAERLRMRLVVSACLSVATTAILTWVERDGEPALPDVLDEAFAIVRHELA